MTKNEILTDQFDLLNNDVERWEWVMKNDITTIYFTINETYCFLEPEHEDDEEQILNFDNIIDLNKGVSSLLEAVGLKCIPTHPITILPSKYNP